MNHYAVNFYRSKTGRSPVDEYLNKLNGKTYAKVARMLELLAENGPELGLPFSRAMGAGLFELRVRGKNETRLFYVFIKNHEIKILHAFSKKTQKTPQKELNLARERQKELTKL
jgi:phage-related protein